MKNIIFLLAFVPTILMGNNPIQGLGAITTAISNGDAEALGAYFDSQVEISVLDKEDYYSKREAISILKDFFAKNKPTSFKEMHQGTSKGKDSTYCIGNMVASSGAYRVYVYMKNDTKGPVIQELRFDKE